MYSCNFVIGSRCQKVRPFHLNNFKSFQTRDTICQVWLKLAQWFWRRFLNFRHFVIISSWKRAGPFIWIKFTQGCFLLSMIEFWRGIFWNLSMYFHYFVVISPWKREGPLIWTNWILSTKEWFVQSLIEIGPVVLEKKIF